MKITLILSTVFLWLISQAGRGNAQQLPARYHRYLEVRSILTALQNSHPEITRLDTIGYSTRWHIPLLRFRISSAPNLDQDKPVALIAGGVHANEVLGPEMVLGFILDFVGRFDRGDRQAFSLIDSLEVSCVPFVNPEGHIEVENGNFHWRKNQCDNDSNGVFDFHDGVDNNRNYDLGWTLANDLNAITPESSMYRGTAPFTQSENIAMREFGWRYHPIVALDYHSPTFGLGEVVYHPWYWRTSDGGHGAAPDEGLMSQIGEHFASLIVNDIGDSTYRSGRSVVSEGDLNSYYYGNFGSAVFTVELSDTTIQDTALVDSIIGRNLPAVYYLLERALEGRISGTVRDSVTLEPLVAEVQVLERINPDILPRLSRFDFGRYDRILEPGFYTLRFIKDGYVTKQINVAVDQTPIVNNILLTPLAPRPPAPTLLFPSNGQRLANNRFEFDWTDADLAERYLIEVSMDSAFGNIVLRDSNLVQSYYPITIADGTYFWRVKAGNVNGWGPYSPEYQFIVDSQSAIDEPPWPAHFTLFQNYPNPFNAQTTISFRLDRPSRVNLRVYSLRGELITTLAHDLRENAGEHRFIWNGRNDHGKPLSSGLYFCELSAERQRISRPMLMIK